MWTRSHSKVIKSISREEIWNRWADVNSWHEWVPDIDHCRLEKPFQTGSQFTLKPKGKSAVTVELAGVEKEQRFTGCTRFFGAMMYHTYEMHKAPEGTRLTVTVKVTGPLGFLWWKLVAEKIANNLPALMRNLSGVVSRPTLKKASPQMEPEKKADTSPPKAPKLQLVPTKAKETAPKPTLKKTRVKATASALKKDESPKSAKPKPKNKGAEKGSPARKKQES